MKDSYLTLGELNAIFAEVNFPEGAKKMAEMYRDIGTALSYLKEHSQKDAAMQHLIESCNAAIIACKFTDIKKLPPSYT